MTKFSFETPIHHLNDFEDLQDFHFTLSMLFKHVEYWRFYLKQRAKGDKAVWLDNSWNEQGEADSIRTLVNIYQDLLPNKVIAPDDPSWEANQILTEFEQLAHYIPRTQIVAVTNSIDIYRTMKPYTKTFAIAYRVRPLLPKTALRRIMPAHFLGLNSIAELLDYKPFTCDTSMPIKLAIMGKTIDDWVAEDCPHIHTSDMGLQGEDFFGACLSRKEIKLARTNIQRLKEVVNNG